jgi:hypothetical protein
MSEMSAKARKKFVKRIAALFALQGSSNAGERENAHRKLIELLHKHGKTWNDLPALLHEAELLEAEQAGGTNPSPDPRDAQPVAPGTSVQALDLVRYLLEQYVELQAHEYIAVSLWVLHTHVYSGFMHTPRLTVTSPVRDCGKSLLIDVIEQLVSRPRKSDGITAAVLYHVIDKELPTLLIDEGDNVGFQFNHDRRLVINSGHKKGGKVPRLIGGKPHYFSTFAPAAIAKIGILPLPIMSRSVVIHMTRAARPLRRFDDTDLQDLNIAYSVVRAWAREVQLDTNPELPTELRRTRPSDNWRPLIAIADSFGPAWGTLAREAAIAFSRGYHDEDIGVVLLADIRDQFAAARVDRFVSATLVAALNEMDGAPWADWRGRGLTQSELAKLLAPFHIRPRVIWPLQRGPKTRSARGYLKSQFASAWESYCNEGVTPSQSRKNIHLVGR